MSVEIPEPTQWLPIEVAAEGSGMSTKQLSRWIKRGRVRWKREGRTVLVDLSSMTGDDEDPMVAMFSQIIGAMKQSHQHTERSWAMVERVVDSLSKNVSQLRTDLAKADADLHENRSVVTEALDTASSRELANTLLERDAANKELLVKLGIAATAEHFMPGKLQNLLQTIAAVEGTIPDAPPGTPPTEETKTPSDD